MITFNRTNLDTLTALAPWHERKQEERIREALGLTRGPLPNIEHRWLHRYYRFLLAHVELPFDAEYVEEVPGYGPRVSSVRVVGLIDPRRDHRGENTGLLCRAYRDDEELEIPLVDLELPEESSNGRLLEDYWYWIWNWRFDPVI
jgi:hypothetical protein